MCKRMHIARLLFDGTNYESLRAGFNPYQNYRREKLDS